MQPLVQTPAQPQQTANKTQLQNQQPVVHADLMKSWQELLVKSRLLRVGAQGDAQQGFGQTV